MLENFHTHTARCRHASGTEEEYICRAIEGGLQTLGFSDHTPILFPGSYYSTMRMYPEELPEYVATLLKLKEKYADQIDIRVGLEAEYYPALLDSYLQLLETADVEYLILGQHWCGNEEGEPHNATPTDDEALLARYCDQVTEAMCTGLYSYVAHPDMFRFTGDEAVYRRHITQFCQTAKEQNIPLEINFLGLREGRHYPRPFFWEIAGEVGCPVVFGCDAHQPEYVFHTATEQKAREMVKKYNLNLLERVPIHSWKDNKIGK